MEWKLIETAPKDADILLCRERTIYICHWGNLFIRQRLDGGGYQDLYGWVKQETGTSEFRGPTHWMPLPAPPAA